MLDVRDVREHLMQLLCRLLLNAHAEVGTSALLAINSILSSFGQVPSQLKQHVQEAVTTLEQQSNSAEQRQLLRTLQRRLSGASVTRYVQRPLPPGTADQCVLHFYTLQQQQSILSKSNNEEILAACTDTRKTTKKTWERVSSGQTRRGEEGGSVAEYAWQMLSQAWDMDKAAQQVVVQALDDDDPLICAAAALLLQRGKDLTPETKQAAGTVIMDILADEERSSRLFERPRSGYYSEERLDDVLFETLRVIVERKN